MGKKNKYSQNDLAQFIYDEYLFKDDTVDINPDKSFTKLIDTKNAIKISGNCGEFNKNFDMIYFLCTKMIEWNPSLEKYKRIRYNSGYLYDDILDNKADKNPEVQKYIDNVFEDGVYYAMIDNDDGDETFAVIKVNETVNDYYLLNFDFYLIGKKIYKIKKKLFKEFNKLNEKFNLSNQMSEAIIYTNGEPTKDTVFKSFDQMVFKDKDYVLHYIDNWKENIPIYYKYDVIPKLSILLYGEPGTGKSTFCKALAKYLGIKTIQSISPDYFDTMPTSENNHYIKPKTQIMNTTQRVLSLDDIDCIGNSRDDDTSIENSRITSALLEYLDNPPTFYFKANNGKYYLVSIVCATTNYIDRLDPAVIRYGRFDLKLKFDRFNVDEAEEMCSLYGLTLKDVYHKKFDSKTTFSPAEIEALCKENIDKALKKDI